MPPLKSSFSSILSCVFCFLAVTSSADHACASYPSQPLRLEYTYSANLKADTKKFEVVRKAAEAARKMFSGLIRVKTNASDTLEPHLIVEVKSGNCPPATNGLGAPRAYGSCGRPVRGYVNFCDPLFRYDEREQIEVMEHELLHVFFFMPNMMKELSSSYTPVSEFETFMVNSFNVREATRRMFDCPFLLGMPSAGGYHWDPEIVRTALQSPFASVDDTFLSEATLAALIDSGFYDVDMGRAQPLPKNAQKGCSSVHKKLRYPASFGQNFETAHGKFRIELIAIDFKKNSFGQMVEVVHMVQGKPSWRSGKIFYSLDAKNCIVPVDLDTQRQTWAEIMARIGNYELYFNPDKVTIELVDGNEDLVEVYMSPPSTAQ